MNFNTITEALTFYNLDFNMALVPIYLFNPDITIKDYQEIFEKKSVVRTDTYASLGVVGNSYTIVHLRDALSSLQPFLDAGSLGVSWFYADQHGAKVNCCFRLNDCSVDLEGILLNAEFAVRLAHDGSSKVLVSVLGRSSTGLVYPFGREYTVAIKHTKNSNVRVLELQNVLNVVKDEWNSFEDFMKYGATEPITRDEAKEFLNKNMGINPETKQGETILETIFTRWSNSLIPSMRNTIFGLYMATCEWAQLDRNVKTTKKRGKQGMNYSNIRAMNLLKDKKIYQTWASMRFFSTTNLLTPTV